MKGLTNSINIVSGGKEEQTKSITITENGTTTVSPDSGKTLSSVSITTEVAGATDLYHGLRPANWPTIKMPNEFEDGEVCEMLIELEFGNTQFIEFPSGFFEMSAITLIDWGDGGSSTNPNYLYSRTSGQDRLFTYSQYNIIKVYGNGDNFISTYYTDTMKNIKILDMSTKTKESLLKQSNYWPSYEGTEVWSNSLLFYSWEETQGRYQYAYQSAYSHIKCFPYCKIANDSESVELYPPLEVFPYIQSAASSRGYSQYIWVHGGSIQDFSTGNTDYWGISLAQYLFFGNSSYTSTTKLDLSTWPYEYLGSLITYETIANKTIEINDFSTVPTDWSMIKIIQSGDVDSIGGAWINRNIVYSPYFTSSWTTQKMRYIYYNCHNLKIASICTTFLEQAEDALEDAFYQCTALEFVYIPENSLKVPINLSSITVLNTGDYYDYEQNTTVYDTDYWKAMVKGLYDFTAAGDTPSYTPTITVSTTVYSELPNHTDDNGTDLLTAITNKGWTISQE